MIFGGNLWLLKITQECGQNNSSWQKNSTLRRQEPQLASIKSPKKKPVVSHTPPHHHFQMHVFVPAAVKPSNHQPSIFHIYTSHKNWRWWWMRRNTLFFCVKFNTNCTQFFGLIPFTFFKFQKVSTFSSLSLSFEFFYECPNKKLDIHITRRDRSAFSSSLFNCGWTIQDRVLGPKSYKTCIIQAFRKLFYSLISQDYV